MGEMQDLRELVRLLDASLDRQQHRQAETALQERERTPVFAVSLLQIASSQDFPNQTRLAAALCFKNFIRRSWTDEEGNHKLPQAEVDTIKQQIVGLMISSPSAVQAQLGEAISVIADSDFPDRWTTLIQDLASKLSPDNTINNNGVLQVAHSIFRRWRPLFRSDALFTEINHVLDHFAEPFLNIVGTTDQRIEQAQNDQTALQQHFATMNTAIKVFYDLSCQELPPAFADNLEVLCTFFDKYLTFDNALLHTDDESEPGVLEYVKAGIFELLTFWAQKYSDDLDAYIPKFVQTSWNMLTSVPTDTKYDVLASRALAFLTSTTSHKQHASIFSDESTMEQIVERVVLPNVTLRDSDLELFEDEPIEFIRRDLEGTDSETRRKAATDLLRSLNESYQNLVTRLVTGYIDRYLGEYAADRANNWRAKDTAVYLFCSIGAVGLVTAAFGVRNTNPHVNVVEFFQTNIAEDLVSESSHVLLKVDSIKFLYIFRSQLSRPQWLEAFPPLVTQLSSPNYVVYTYSAIAIERILYLNNESREPLVQRTDLAPHAEGILKKLFALIQKDPTPQKMQENEFLMRAIMRVLIVMRDGVVQFHDFILENFITIMRSIRENPSNPRFYYYLFEAIGALIKFAAPAAPDKFETALYPPFAEVLRQDIQEFMPYVFQLMASLLEANPTGKLSVNYQSILPVLLNQDVWEMKGYAPALTRLLGAMIPRAAAEIVAEDRLQPTLGVFQNLLAKKSTEGNAFDLLEAIFTYIPVTALQPFFADIFNLILTRLSKSKTDNLALRFVRFYHVVSSRNEDGLGADVVDATAEGIQQGLFGQLYTGVILTETPKFTKPLDRKIAVISFTKTLGDSQAFADKYARGWARTCDTLLQIMLNPPVLTRSEDVIDDQDVDDLSFGVGFTQLSTCRAPVNDLYADIQNIRSWIGEYLNQANQRHNGRVSKFIQERLTQETRDALQTYMQT